MIASFEKDSRELHLAYVVGVQGIHHRLEMLEKLRLSAKRWKGLGRPPKLLRRDKQHQPISVKQLAESLAASSWENVSWREGTKQRLRSRFAAQRVRIAHRDYWRSELPAEEWLLIEWPTGRERTNEVLAFYPSGRSQTRGLGETSQASLDH